MRMRWMTFNVKDLFEAGAITSPGKEETRLTLEQHKAKLEALAMPLRSVMPNVICLQEIASEASLRSLLALAGMESYSVAFGEPDDRGIRCAIASSDPIVLTTLLRETDLPFVRFNVADPEPYPGRLLQKRSMVASMIETKTEGRVLVTCLHLKSNRPLAIQLSAGGSKHPGSMTEDAEGHLRSAIVRCGEALSLRRYLDGEFKRDPSLAVVVGGDFNDHPDSLPVRCVLGSDPNEPPVRRGVGALSSVTRGLGETLRTSALHQGVPIQIDHLLVSQNILRRVGNVKVENGALQNHDDKPFGTFFPDSDHAPVWFETI